MISGNLGYTDHEIVDSKILMELRKESSGVQTLEFSRTDFSVIQGTS